MTKFQFYRRWISFLKPARKLTNVLGVLIALGIFAYFAPPEIFNSNPATGGDTGSHFWPLWTLVKQGLPHWHVRVWNPGNLGGEPHHTHYFPFPYLLMAFLSLFMPLGRAFNIGTFLPVVIFPLCVYYCFRGLKARFPIPLLATLASLCFLYNESFSMWGGNVLSTLAGQFAHVYAFDFFLLGMGAFNWEMDRWGSDRRNFPWLTMFCFAGVLLSHFYVALYLPIVFLVFLFLHPAGNLKTRLHTLVKLGLGSLALSAWFVIPMLHNSKWNTAFGLKWGTAQLLLEAFPKIFWPVAGGAVLFGLMAIVFAKRRGWLEREWRVIPALLISIILISAIFYFIFPPLGLVDVRVFPPLQLMLCLLFAFVLGTVLHQKLDSVWTWFVTVILIGVFVWWPVRQIYNLPYWLKWNYSGWEAKSSYQDVQALANEVRGNFSQPRVIYENSDLSNSAGTMRVFEMLPYFSGRATLESVYMQATILAPAAFYMQALISKTPSCPFPNYQCTGYNISRLPDYLKLMGVSQLILISDEVMAQANSAPFLVKKGDYGLWHVYDSKVEAPLVEVLHQPPQFFEDKDFKKVFYEWFLNYDASKPFLVQAPEKDRAAIQASIAAEDCHPQLQVDFDQMKLTTDCPGKYHILKFAYHSTFKASTGDSLYLTSPGFIGIIPSQSEVVLKWGQHWLWTLSDMVSWAALFGILAYWIYSRLRRGES